MRGGKIQDLTPEPISPDQYPASDWLGHGVFDSGGVTRAGAPAFWESMKHKWDNSGLGTKGK